MKSKITIGDFDHLYELEAVIINQPNHFVALVNCTGQSEPIWIVKDDSRVTRLSIPIEELAATPNATPVIRLYQRVGAEAAPRTIAVSKVPDALIDFVKLDDEYQVSGMILEQCMIAQSQFACTHSITSMRLS